MMRDDPNAQSDYRFSVAPMMDWTDRHCRQLHRALSRRSRLYTEMINAGAIVHGDSRRHLRFDKAEHPLALQLGGSDPVMLAKAAAVAAAAGYDEINLNCGCPSERVQEGSFGACLMLEAGRVAACVAAMKQASGLPVTVKCRIGVDATEGDAFLLNFVDTVAAAGCGVFIIHARKAWLSGLSPKQNREIPPLHYDVVYRLKQLRPVLTIVVNGGIETLAQCEAHVRHVDGVMVGRAAYHTPRLLMDVDRRLFGDETAVPDPRSVMASLRPYVEAQLAEGVRLQSIVRHWLGLFHGEYGARAFRRVLSERAFRPNADWGVVEAALAALGGSMPADVASATA